MEASKIAIYCKVDTSFAMKNFSPVFIKSINFNTSCDSYDLCIIIQKSSENRFAMSLYSRNVFPQLHCLAWYHIGVITKDLISTKQLLKTMDNFEIKEGEDLFNLMTK